MSVFLPKPPSFRLDGKRALVTGASRGIGLASAAALAEAGAHVVLAARSRDDLTDAAEAIRKAGGKAEILPLDVADLSAALAAIERAGAFDILFNNAGINRPGPFLDATPDDFDAVFSVNVRAAYFIAQSVARGMIAEGRGGSIIQTSSQMGHVGGVDRTVYAASKHALEGLTKAMAIELGKHAIRVNTICPTFVATALTATTMQDPDRMDWIRSKIHLGRVGEVTDVTGAVVFLASDSAALITGSSVMIDGGWTAG
ncbi:SDR family NAD(P)-dependent oxidoreductase [Stappia sp. ES.058]|uniref:SDR family NAD(P)-dependent oxidoreductase n=1 Tax=Stappia sp. ES.058 TaxID=1881061 RepID=UPI00087AE24E|nr:SDR family NAD(P)-dependent oxidoreductase [Stappia sp. ES.058]SDU48268.1 NAD(P)-dependent dehydrogenase, short-chain alcohol dehydrogenase family [Stappia sp. ES.058]